jgi:hypothetical protein
VPPARLQAECEKAISEKQNATQIMRGVFA